MLKILFIGDIVGKIGRQTVAKILPKIKREYKLDLVVANADNIAHGSGVTEGTLKELVEAGVDFFTNGDHAFNRMKQADCYETMPVIRPANFSADVPGKGYELISVGKHKILLVNLIGRVFMERDHDCPFKKADEILAMFTRKNLSAIIVDIHAEATSEKVCLGHYLNGRASAVLGTHTHIMTADEKVMDKGTAYITDTGMVGAADESLGVAKEGIIKTFLTQVKYPHVIPKNGRAMLNSVLVSVDPKASQTKSIERITKFVNIK